MYEFDVAITFAGEQRDYAEQVANILDQNGVRVFYDKNYEIDLWGKDLISYLDDVYRNKAKYCLMLISKEYLQKPWTSHEKRSAFARDLRERGYILPVRFDDSEMKGLPESVYFFDARKKYPKDIAEAILIKLNKNVAVAYAAPKFRTPKMKKTFNPYEEMMGWIAYLSNQFKLRCNESDNLEFSTFDRNGTKCMRFLRDGEAIYSLNISMGGFRDHGLQFYGIQGEMRSFSDGASNAFGELEWSNDKNCIVLKLQDMSLLELALRGDSYYSREEFLDALWNKVCDAIEKD